MKIATVLPRPETCGNGHAARIVNEALETSVTHQALARSRRADRGGRWMVLTLKEYGSTMFITETYL